MQPTDFYVRLREQSGTDHGLLRGPIEVSSKMYLYWNINLPVGKSGCGSAILNVRESPAIAIENQSAERDCLSQNSRLCPVYFALQFSSPPISQLP
jgi:hypothetical protein